MVLKGTFSFEDAIHPDPEGGWVIEVEGPVTIRGEDATILGGGSSEQDGFQAVFLVDAEGADVTIGGIRFTSPHNAAVRVSRSTSLRIGRCQVDGIVTSLVTVGGRPANGAVAVHLVGGPFGHVSILENRLRLGGSEGDLIGGIVVVGSAEHLRIADNRVAGTTAHGIDLRNVGGAARVEDNVVETGSVGRGGEAGSFVDALRLIGSGDYVVAGNRLDCGFRNAAVIRLGGTKDAVVRQNEIVASMAAGEDPGAESAGVQVRGSAERNELRANRIRGRGRVAISVIASTFPADLGNGTGMPSRTTFTGNNVQQFTADLATVEIGPGVQETTITGGSGSIIDGGIGTAIQGNFQPPD